MYSWSDSSIAFLNTLFQWLAAGSTAIALLSAVCLIFVNAESSKRQEQKTSDLERKLVASGKAVTDANDKITKLQAKATTAQQTLLELQDLAKPRQITEIQKTQIASVLSGSPKGKVLVTYPMEDSEAYAFAQQIAAVLRDAQWEVTGPTIVATFGSGPPLIGLKIFIRDKNNIPVWVDLLCNALFKAGLEPRSRMNTSLPEDVAEIYVGIKPPSK